MNAYAILVVNDHLETLRAEAAARRSFSVDRSGIGHRMRAAAASIRAALSTPVESATGGLPALTDYPYRS